MLNVLAIQFLSVCNLLQLIILKSISTKQHVYGSYSSRVGASYTYLSKSNEPKGRHRFHVLLHVAAFIFFIYFYQISF